MRAADIASAELARIRTPRVHSNPHPACRLERIRNPARSSQPPLSAPEGIRPWEKERRSNMFEIKRKIHRVGRPQADPRNRPDGPPGRRRGAGHLRRDHGPGHRRLREVAQARPGLLPPDRQLPGKVLRRRQDPRRLLHARGPSLAEGNPDLPPDRPADPAAVRQGLQERDPGRHHRARARPGERSRHRRHGRRLRRPDAVGRAVHGSDRRARASARSTANTSSTRRWTR